MDIRELAEHFEGTKVGFRHSKDGIILQIAVHPDELPIDIVKDRLGQRYQVALVRIDVDEQPVGSPDIEEGIRAVKLAGTLCSNPDFQMWLCFKQHADEVSESAAVEAVRRLLGVTSRAELKTNKKARNAMLALRDQFVLDMKS